MSPGIKALKREVGLSDRRTNIPTIIPEALLISLGGTFFLKAN